MAPSITGNSVSLNSLLCCSHMSSLISQGPEHTHILGPVFFLRASPGSSAGKESTCNAGDPGLIPGLGRSPGEWIDYPLQYSWASLVAEIVKNLPAMWETWGWSLGWEDPLEEGMATHSSIHAWTEEPGGLQSIGSQRVWTEQLSTLFLNLDTAFVQNFLFIK